ncbi:MAG: GNAT family N-acetyltransferase [Planctomycetes bacterium]|nr:GNAT family N-acetyltransferase [Planctomycetota bacterium]
MYVVPNAKADEVVLSLVSKSSPRDALACYYLFDCPESEVVVDADGRGRAFLVKSPNPFDAQRPVVIVRATDGERVERLVRESLEGDQEFVFVVTPDVAGPLRRALAVRVETTSAIFSVTRRSFRPHPAAETPVCMEDGQMLKYCVRNGGDLLSSAGVLWESSRFAELFVFTETASRGKGYGRAVASACTANCLERGRTPLYIPEESDEATISVCRSLGYRSTGDRDYTCIGRVFGRQRSN